MKTKTITYSLLAVLALSAFAFADDTTTGLSGVTTAVSKMCTDLKDMLPIVAMMMVIAAGVIYAAGQIMGAETRARANTWATAMLVGAIFAILIVVIAPEVLKSLYPSGTFAC